MTEKHQAGMASSVGGSLLTKSKERIMLAAPSDGEPMVRLVNDAGRPGLLGRDGGRATSSAGSGSCGLELSDPRGRHQKNKDSSNFLDIDEDTKDGGELKRSEIGWFSQSRGKNTMENVTQNNEALASDNDAFTEPEVETTEMELEESAFAPQQSQELLHGRHRNSTYLAQDEDGRPGRPRHAALLEPQTILRLPESGISQRKTEQSQFERVSALMTHEQQTEREVQAFNLADLDSARTNEPEEYSARRGLHENQKLTNLASKYINVDSTELIPLVEKRAVPVPPNKKPGVLYQHNSAEKRLKRSRGPDQPAANEEAIAGAVAAMS